MQNKTTETHWIGRTRYLTWLGPWLVATLLATVACGGTPESETAAEQATAELRLPVSLNDVMVALINNSADPIWIAAWHPPEAEEQWRELERHAVQLELGGALLAYPGTGPFDDEWTSQDGWREWTDQLRDAGAQTVAAVEARDLEAISAAGDRIVEVCEGCHTQYRFAMPTGGKFGEISPNAADLEAEEETGDDGP